MYSWVINILLAFTTRHSRRVEELIKRQRQSVGAVKRNLLRLLMRRKTTFRRLPSRFKSSVGKVVVQLVFLI